MRRLTAALLLLALATVAACGASNSNLRSKTQRVGCDACHTTWQ